MSGVARAFPPQMVIVEYPWSFAAAPIAMLVATPGCFGRPPPEPEPEPEVGIGACDTDLEPEFVGASRVVHVDPRDAPLAWDLGLINGQIALTFDDGPAPDTTRSILETLDAHNVKATFFVVGQNVDVAPEVVREIAAAGHTLGSHSYSHPDLTELTLDEALHEVRRGQQALVNATGIVVPPALFRFPRFASTEELEDAVIARAMTPVFANVVAEDWLIPDPTELLERSLDALEEAGGGVILLHDIQPQTALMLDAFLKEILARGYETVVLRPAPTLASLGARSDLRVGAALFTPPPGAQVTATALRELNMFTMPAYFRIIQAVEGVYDFTLPDRTVEAAPPGTVVRGHTLVWCENNPEWLLEADLGADALEAILVEHVRTVVGHYRGRFPEQVVAWDVVNEPLSWQGPGCLWNRIGIERGEGDLAYVRLALQTARDADPDAALYLNDFAIEAPGERADRMVALVEELRSGGVPLDGVGLQSHFALGEDGPLPPPAQMTEMVAVMGRLADLGIELAITEADVALPINGVTEHSLNEQAAAYGEVVQACLATPACTSFVTWGVGDADSWIPDFFPGWGAPLLFDDEYAAKPAYHSVRCALAAGR